MLKRALMYIFIVLLCFVLITQHFRQIYTSGNAKIHTTKVLIYQQNDQKTNKHLLYGMKTQMTKSIGFSQHMAPVRKSKMYQKYQSFLESAQNQVGC